MPEALYWPHQQHLAALLVNKASQQRENALLNLQCFSTVSLLHKLRCAPLNTDFKSFITFEPSHSREVMFIATCATLGLRGP